jgi:uncharacterized protein
MSDDKLKHLIKILNLQPLSGEGGLFRQTYKSAEHIPQDALPVRYSGEHAFVTAIYYLLTDHPDSFSAIHRLPTDEIYHFYLGDPVEMLLLYPDGGGQVVILGPDVFAGQQVQYVAPHSAWQGCRLQRGGRFALMGTTTAPGYENSDYVAGSRAILIQQYPAWTEWVSMLTR